MNAIHAYETALWNSIPYEIRKSISNSATHSRFNTLYYIIIGTPIWNDRDNIRNILTNLGYKTELKPQAGDGNGTIIEYELNIYWEHPRKMTYWE